MHQLFVHPQLLLEVFGFGALRGQQRHNAGVFAFADAPHMQVAECCRDRTGGNHFADFGDHRGVHFSVQQDPARVPQQPVGPHRDQACANNAHDRIEPAGGPKFTGHQCNDGQHRRCGIRDQMQIGRAVVQVLVVLVGMLMRMVFGVVMPVRPFQQPDTGQIDQQANQRNGNRLVVLDWARSDQAFSRLIKHHAGHQHQ